VKRPISSEFATIMAMPDTPTPAIEAVPSLPTHIMSIAGPIMPMVLLINIGQDKDQRLPKMLPFVQSFVNLVPFLKELPIPSAINNQYSLTL
jgi:hypothetical protein